LKISNLTGNPSFCIILAYFLAANLDSSSLLAPVQTILPDEKMRAVVRGALILIIKAAKRFGLYSELRACNAIAFKSNLQPTLIVLTIFLFYENEKKKQLKNSQEKIDHNKNKTNCIFGSKVELSELLLPPVDDEFELN
jgi:hypothetical protein